MKKLLAVTLILALIFPAAAGSALTLSGWMIWGSWNHFEALENGMLLTSIYLEDDGTAYFVTQMFSGGEPGTGRAYVGSWEFSGDKTVSVKAGDNTTIELMYMDYNEMDDTLTGDMYFRAEYK